MRWIIITVALLVFLGAGLAAVIFVLGNFETLANEDQQEVLVRGYVSIDNMAFPVNTGAAVDHYVGIDLKLEVADGRKVGEIEILVPRIRDAILRDAHKSLPRRADNIESIDLVKVKERAKAKANEVLGNELVARVLVTRVAKLVA
jgi:flagellar basal body-associated protein FliL